MLPPLESPVSSPASIVYVPVPYGNCRLPIHNLKQISLLAWGPSKKTRWSDEEDILLQESVTKNGTNNWSSVAAGVPGRTGKQCRERWINHLRPALNRDEWTTEEDSILVDKQKLHGNSWSTIAQFLPGRSSNAVKNRWSWLKRHNNKFMDGMKLLPNILKHSMNKVMPSIPPLLARDNGDLGLEELRKIPVNQGETDEVEALSRRNIPYGMMDALFPFKSQTRVDLAMAPRMVDAL